MMKAGKYYHGTLELRLSKYSQPFYFPLKPDITTISLISDILTVFEIPPEYEVHIRNVTTEFPVLNLSAVDKLDSDLLNGSFYVSFIEVDLHVLEFYEKKNDTLLMQTPHPSYRTLIKDKSSKLYPYQSVIFKHKLLVYSFTDIINDKSTPVSDEIENWITLIDPSIIISALIEVASTQFADRYLWTNISNDKVASTQILPTDKRIYLFITILAKLALFNTQHKQIIKAVIEAFRPSELSTVLLQSFFSFIYHRSPYDEAALILTDLFGTTWLYECFESLESFRKFVFTDSISLSFPFLYLRYIITALLEEQMSAEEAIKIISSFAEPDLVLSGKIAKSIIYPSFDAMYKHIFADEVLTQSMVGKNDFPIVKKILDIIQPILERYVAPYDHVQYSMLCYIQKYLAKRSFYPTGICYTVVKFMHANKIITNFVINAWADTSATETTAAQTPGRESALVETLSFIVSEVPNVTDFVINKDK